MEVSGGVRVDTLMLQGRPGDTMSLSVRDDALELRYGDAPVFKIEPADEARVAPSTAPHEAPPRPLHITRETDFLAPVTLHDGLTVDGPLRSAALEERLARIEEALARLAPP